jgi:hypothetical protein
MHVCPQNLQQKYFTGFDKNNAQGTICVAVGDFGHKRFTKRYFVLNLQR